jgi:multicomponent Na+:H+ antiporter subunit D
MLAAMAIAAACCVGIGCFPTLFYSILPFNAEFHPYSLDHVVGQVQLLFLSALAFTLLMRTGIYPPELRSTNLDFDWLYRRPGRGFALAAGHWIERAWQLVATRGSSGAREAVNAIERHHGLDGVLARSWPTGAMALWMTIMLAAYLVLSYL